MTTNQYALRSIWDYPFAERQLKFFLQVLQLWLLLFCVLGAGLGVHLKVTMMGSWIMWLFSSFLLKMIFGVMVAFPWPELPMLNVVLARQEQQCWMLFLETDFIRGFGGGGGAVMPPYGSRAKPCREPGSKAPRNFKDLVLWNHLLLIKIHPPQPVVKLIQHIFFF